MKEIVIKPLTRVEGHLGMTIQLDERGKISKVMANFAEFRGFEKFLENRFLTRVPIIVTRICGVCPVPHHMASVKAIEDGLNLKPTETAEKLRELMLMGEVLGDHTLHLFILAGVDYLLTDIPMEQRDVVSLYRKFPDVTKDVVYVREVGQKIVEVLGVQAVHPMTAVPGGITKKLSEDMRVKLLKYVTEAKKKVLKWYDSVFNPVVLKYVEENLDLGYVSSNYMAMSYDGQLNYYRGDINIINDKGGLVASFKPIKYVDYLIEEPLPYSYGKSVTLKGKGIKEGLLRTGPLARVNVPRDAPTENASRLLKEFRKIFGSPIHGTLQYNLARYVCTVYAAERLEELLSDKTITKDDIRENYRIEAGEGAGSVEASRGTLIHHYKWNDEGYITYANIITPTVVNANGFEASFMSVALRNVSDGMVNEEKLWYETGLVIRAYDPCISCATHIEKSLTIRILSHEGKLIKVIGCG